MDAAHVKEKHTKSFYVSIKIRSQNDQKYMKALTKEFMRQIEPGFELIYSIGSSGVRNIRKVLREFNNIPHISSVLYKLEKVSPMQSFLQGTASGKPLVVKHRQTRLSLLALEGHQFYSTNFILQTASQQNDLLEKICIIATKLSFKSWPC